MPSITHQYIAVTRRGRLQNEITRGLRGASVGNTGQALVIRQAFSALVQLNPVGCQHVKQAEHGWLVVSVHHRVEEVFIRHRYSIWKIRGIRIVQGNSLLAHLEPIR